MSITIDQVINREVTLDELKALSDAELMKLERGIARLHIGKYPYFAIGWAIVNFFMWLSLWPLVFMGFVPLWLGAIIATINVILAYLPSHECQHGIIAREGEKGRWFNELIGHMSAFPLAIPYRALRVTHMEHHKHTNDPELDPDYGTMAPNLLAAIWRTVQARQPRFEGAQAYQKCLERLDNDDAKKAGADALLMQLIFYGTLFACAWTGFALEAALLWWIPQHVSLAYNQLTLSWAPHHPGKGQGRYSNTRAFRAMVGNILTCGMQFHIIHHLHPRIPLYRTPKAYWQMRPVLEARGCDLGGL